MKLKKDIKKDILIIFLVVLSIYQTRELWFRNSLNHNFFYINHLKDNVNKNYMSRFLSPYRIIANSGDNKFYIFYENLREKEIKNFIDYVIQLTAKEGKYIEKHKNIDWEKILKEKSFIYEYKFPINFNIFSKVFKEKRNLFSSLSEKFDSIIISTDPKNTKRLNIYFIDKKHNCYYKYKLIKSGINELIIMYLQNTYKNLKDDDIYYISSKLIGLKFEENIFIPKWQGDFYNYRLIKGTKLPLYFNKDNSVVGSSISLFFDNPSVVWQDNKKDTYIYSDENTVVKYFPDNILEYINYKNILERKKRTLMEDYSAAINFIDNDIFVKNNYFLDNYEEDNNMRKFYFDYTINGFPIKFDYISDNNDLSHFIEVTVKNGTVIKYRKLAFIYEEIYDEGEKIYIDATKTINNLKINNVQNISLEYTFPYENIKDNENYEDVMNLNWVIN